MSGCNGILRLGKQFQIEMPPPTPRIIPIFISILIKIGFSSTKERLKMDFLYSNTRFKLSLSDAHIKSAYDIITLEKFRVRWFVTGIGVRSNTFNLRIFRDRQAGDTSTNKAPHSSFLTQVTSPTLDLKVF